jgi:hypothetical protein
MNTEKIDITKLPLPERIRRGNEICWRLWLKAQQNADYPILWGKCMDNLTAAVNKLQGLVTQANLEGYYDCPFGREYERCIADDTFICFGCPYRPAAERQRQGGDDQS